MENKIKGYRIKDEAFYPVDHCQDLEMKEQVELCLEMFVERYPAVFAVYEDGTEEFIGKWLDY